MSVKYSLKGQPISTHIYFNPKNSDSLDDIKTILESDDTIKFPNRTDMNDTYENVTKYIYMIIDTSRFLCKGLNLGFIRDAFETANAIIVISSPVINILPNGNIFGFALINFNETDNSIYINVICSHVGIKYAGDIMIRTISRMCSMLFIRKITLKSISSAISFYEKYGFYKKGLCEDSKAVCEMEKIIVKGTLGGKRGKTIKRKHKKANKKRKYTQKRGFKSSSV